MELTAREFKDQYCKPLVYAWKRGEQYMYIGHCKHGFRRILSDHTSFILDEMEDTDTIEIYAFENNKECLRSEKDMINRYHPLRNGVQGRGSLRYYASEGDDQY